MTWLFIPLSFVPASECSAKASELHSNISDSSIEPFVTWSGKPVQPANLPRLWKRERSMKRLSGLTLSRSTAQLGADAWIASLPDSLVKTCQSRESVQDSTASAPDSSSKSAASPTIAVRDSSFWRTSQASLLPPPPLWTKPKANSTSARPPESWENWPTAGGMRSGRIFARPTSVQVTSGSDGSALHGEMWHTSTTMAAKGVEYQRQADGSNLAILSGQAQQWATPDANAMERTNRSDSPNAAVRPTLALAAAQWSTPNVPNGGRSVSAEVVANRGKTENGKRQVGLESEVRHWATPTSSENSNRTTKMAPTHGNGHGLVLAGQACSWATPTARDHKDGGTSMENVEVNGLLGRQVLMTSLHPVHSTIDGKELSPTARILRRRLNPAFTCWLMGWPIWWTNPAITNSVKPETELWRSKLQRRLSFLLGEPEFFKEVA